MSAKPALAPTRPDEESIERRRHPRIAIDCPVYLSWRDRQETRVLRGRAMDISKLGMLVEAERAIAPGTVISVETNSRTLGTACVRHCTPSGMKFRIGLHLPDRMSNDF